MIHSQSTVRLSVFVMALLMIVGAAFVAPVSAQSSPVQEDTVSASGSTVTINTGGAASIGVDQLPTSNVSVSNISDGGAVPSSNADGIAWSSAARLPETVSFTLTPDSSYSDGDTVSFTVDGTAVSLAVQEQSNSAEEVTLSGSTITVETGSEAAVGVDNLPDDVSVSEISDSGAQPPSNQDGIVWNSLGGLPSTVSFTLTPGSSYEAGDTITFTAAGTERTLSVVESSTPDEIADTVSNKQYKSWAGNDNQIDQQEAIEGFNGWFNEGSHKGENLKQQQALDLFNYWFNNG